MSLRKMKLEKLSDYVEKERRLLNSWSSFFDMIASMPDDCEDAVGFGQILRHIYIQVNKTEPELMAKKYGLI